MSRWEIYFSVWQVRSLKLPRIVYCLLWKLTLPERLVQFSVVVFQLSMLLFCFYKQTAIDLLKFKWFLLLDKNSFAVSHSKTFLWTLTMFLKASQNSQENTCAVVSLFLEALLKSDSSTCVFLWNLRIFSGHLSWRTPENGCFCVDFFF